MVHRGSEIFRKNKLVRLRGNEASEELKNQLDLSVMSQREWGFGDYWEKNLAKNSFPGGPQVDKCVVT